MFRSVQHHHQPTPLSVFLPKSLLRTKALAPPITGERENFFFREQSEKAMYDFDQISTTHGVVSADWQFDTEFNDTVTFL